MNRRDVMRRLAATGAGVFMATPWAARAPAQSAATRRRVTVAGRRVRTIDAHAHVSIPEAAALMPGNAGRGLSAAGGYNLVMSPERLQAMDAQGIDVEVLSVNPFWYGLDRDLSARLIAIQNEKLAALVAARPERFAALATVALQHPDLASEQLEEAVTKWRLPGAAIGASVNGEELANPRFDPFWAKAEALGAVIFMHPQQGQPNPRLQGRGALGVAVGNPIETTIALSHLIFEGTLDRFPRLKLCVAHGGGYLPSYSGRTDHGCSVFPDQCQGAPLARKPSEYLKQLYIDSLVFTPEGLRHLVATVGADHIVLGTDYPYPWTSTAVDHVLQTPQLHDAERIAILGGTAARLLGIPLT